MTGVRIQQLEYFEFPTDESPFCITMMSDLQNGISAPLIPDPYVSVRTVTQYRRMLPTAPFLIALINFPYREILNVRESRAGSEAAAKQPDHLIMYSLAVVVHPAGPVAFAGWVWGA